MKRLTLLCWLAAAAALAAPIPKPKESEFQGPGWGKPIDPDKDCKFTFRRDSLTIEVPGKDHDIDHLGKRKNAPRLLRNVEGDFRVEVRVRGLAVGASAGLIVLAEGKTWSMVTMELGSSPLRIKDVVRDEPAFTNENAQGLADSTDRDRSSSPKITSAYLRIDRQDGECRGYSSADGKKWREYANPRFMRAFVKSPKAKVGVFARLRFTKAPFEVTFDQFKFTPLKAKAK